MSKEKIKAAITSRCVEALIGFGYSDVTIDNIFSDAVYSQLFSNMLTQMELTNSSAVTMRQELLERIDEEQKPFGE